MKKLSVALILITAGIYYTSCNKNNDLQNPDPATIDSATIMGFKDSTQLIKSIRTIWTDSLGNFTDSSTFYLYYDTLNKKVNFNTEYVTSPIPTPNSYVFSYDNIGLIIQAKSTDADGIATTDYTYDAQNVLSSETHTNADGVETVHLTKTSLSSGGYSLSAKSSNSNFIYDSILNTYYFDAMSKLISWTDLELPSQTIGHIDSIIYDASGNVNKVIETNLSYGIAPSTHTLFEFTSRDTKGSQLYNMNSILFNGIADFPEVNFEGSIELGSPINGYRNYYFYQFTKYPSPGTKVYQYFNDSYLTFNPNPQYDRKNRLVKYKMYNGDGTHYYEEWDFNYYK